jgi:hypothetical protein
MTPDIEARARAEHRAWFITELGGPVQATASITELREALAAHDARVRAESAAIIKALRSALLSSVCRTPGCYAGQHLLKECEHRSVLDATESLRGDAREGAGE